MSENHTRTPTTYKVSFTGDELSPLVDKIEDALEGAPFDMAIVALLSIYIVASKPSIEPEELERVLGDISTYACMLLGGPDITTMLDGDDEQRKRLLN